MEARAEKDERAKRGHKRTQEKGEGQRKKWQEDRTRLLFHLSSPSHLSFFFFIPHVPSGSLNQPWEKFSLWIKALNSGISKEKLFSELSKYDSGLKERKLPQIPKTLEGKHLTLADQIKSGGEGTVYRNTIGGRPVALKVPFKSRRRGLEKEANLIYKVSSASTSPPTLFSPPVSPL